MNPNTESPDCPSDLLIMVAALRGELPVHDRASPEQVERIRAVVAADLARVDALAARNADADAALYYERTQARLASALRALASDAESVGRTKATSEQGKTLGVGAAAAKSVTKVAPLRAKMGRVGAADSARVRVQTQAAGAALLGAA